MLNKRLKVFLESHHIHYDMLPWVPGKTTDEFSDDTDWVERGLARSMIMKSKRGLVMIVEPMLAETDLERWRELTGYSDLNFANNIDLEDILLDIDRNDIPAIGDLFDMDVYLDDRLASGHDITFCSGSPAEFIKMPYQEYVRYIKPKLFHIH